MSYPTHIFTEIVKDKTGSNKKLAQELFLSKGTYPIIDQGKKFIAGYTNDEQSLMQSTELPVVIFGDHTKSIKYIDFPFALGADGVKILKPIEACEVKYLYHFLLHAKIPDAGYSRHFKFLKELQIPLPPLEEQRRIAEILDKADALIQNRKKAIEKLDELLQATFIDMFGDPVTNPKGWKQEYLGVISQFENGDRSSNYPSGKDVINKGIPFLSTKNIVNNRYNEQSLNFISEDKFNSLTKGKTKQGDILITLRGTLGATCLFYSQYESAFINAQMMIIRSNNQITNHFLHSLFSTSTMQDYFKRIGQGAAVPQLTSSQLKNLQIIFPPTELQNQWVKSLKAIEEQKQKMQEQLEVQETLFKSLQQQAFSGQL